MSTPAIMCEHRGLSSALQGVGLPAVAVWADSEGEAAALSSLPVTFIALTPLEYLLREPRWAWLSLPEVHVWHLPSCAELKEIFDPSLRPSPLNEDRARLLHPLGQWLWALEQFEEPLQQAKRDEVLLRLRKLHRFAARHWPRWFEQALDEIKNCFANDDFAGAGHILGALRTSSGEVAALQTLSPLKHAAQQGGLPIATAELGLTLSGVRCGRVTRRDALRAVKNSKLADTIAPGLESVLRQLERMQRIGLLPDSEVMRRVAVMNEALQQVLRFSATLYLIQDDEAWSDENVIAAEGHLRVMADNFSQLEPALRKKLEMSLSGRF